MSEYARSPRASHHLHVLVVPLSDAIHKWIATSRNHALTSVGLSCTNALEVREEQPPPQVASMVPSESHRGRGKFQALASDASKNGVQGAGGEYARGLHAGPNCMQMQAKRQPPASVEDPEPSSEDSEDGATRTQEGCTGGPGNTSSHLQRQTPCRLHRPSSPQASMEDIYTSSDND
jgi:hypothetical protein